MPKNRGRDTSREEIIISKLRETIGKSINEGIKSLRQVLKSFNASLVEIDEEYPGNSSSLRDYMGSSVAILDRLEKLEVNDAISIQEKNSSLNEMYEEYKAISAKLNADMDAFKQKSEVYAREKDRIAILKIVTGMISEFRKLKEQIGKPTTDSLKKLNQQCDEQINKLEENLSTLREFDVTNQGISGDLVMATNLLINESADLNNTIQDSIEDELASQQARSNANVNREKLPKKITEEKPQTIQNPQQNETRIDEMLNQTYQKLGELDMLISRLELDYRFSEGQKEIHKNDSVKAHEMLQKAFKSPRTIEKAESALAHTENLLDKYKVLKETNQKETKDSGELLETKNRKIFYCTTVLEQLERKNVDVEKYRSELKKIETDPSITTKNAVSQLERLHAGMLNTHAKELGIHANSGSVYDLKNQMIDNLELKKDQSGTSSKSTRKNK